MARAKTTGFSLPEEMQPDLELVVNAFAGGNRSEFLRIAVREYKGRLLAQKLSTLRAEARQEKNGRIYTSAEIRALVAAAKGKKPPVG